MEIWKSGTECPHPRYADFKKHLNNASYHYAAEGGKEFELGNTEERKAVDIAIESGYPYWAMRRMFGEIKPLVHFDGFMEKLLQQMRK